MAKDSSTHKKSFFKNKDGDVVTWQMPNPPLYGWLLFKLLALVVGHSKYTHGFELVSMAFLFTWAYLEVVDGENYFRNVLGLVVIIALILSYLK